MTLVKFFNEYIKKYYFVDFLFEDLKLIIELDGTQHRKTTEQDKLRDNYISSLGYNIIRVTHTEYQKQTRILEIKQLLNIT